MPVKQDRRRPGTRKGPARRPQRGRYGRSRRTPWRLLPLRDRVHVTVLGVLVLACLVVSTVFVVRTELADSSAAADEARRQAALSAARQQALNFTTIGYKTVDRDIDRVIKGSTGDFKASYQQNRKTIKETVTKNKSTSKGEVLSAGIKTIDSDSATALVVVDASVTNVGHRLQTLQTYRMEFGPAKLDNGRWPVSGVEFVG